VIVVLLPAYNEERSLHMLLPKFASSLASSGVEWRVIICNDGSTDGTAKVIAQYAGSMPIEVIHHKINRGLGETARDLFERAAEICAPQDVIIRMDCDDTHEPNVMASMIAKLDEGYDVVIASRFQPGGGQRGVDGRRAWISRLANLFMKLFFPIPNVREYSCGFRAYRAATIQNAIKFWGNDFISLKGLGFTGTLEKLIKLNVLGARITEVPFVLRYDQKHSRSQMIFSLTTLGYLTMTVLYYWPWGGWRHARKWVRTPPVVLPPAE
jgi:dolichol-phosphate mannosyltransferase